MLGIPTVVDRFIQQAILQGLTPIFDPQFSDRSFGFRPGRTAHQAVRQVRRCAEQGAEWVVDLDLEKFFDRMNHDILMARVARRVQDRGVLRLIRRYLQAGLLFHGVRTPRTLGAAQGGPLSPLLANVLLDDLDKELERRGLAFVRYADDAMIVVHSRRAGKRVLASVTRFLDRTLHLPVNQTKCIWSNEKGSGALLVQAPVRVLKSQSDPVRFDTSGLMMREGTSPPSAGALENPCAEQIKVGPAIH